MRVVPVAVAFSLVLLSGLGGAAVTNERCGSTSWLNDCPGASSTGTQIDIGGTNTSPGASGPGERGGGSSAPAEEAAIPPCATVLCRGNYTVSTVPDVTIQDLASFVPHRPRLVAEPAGIGIVGMATNLVSGADVHYLDGTVLGYDVTVRFSPIRYVFSYGDGSISTTDTAGSSWSATGQGQFTPTPTSHTYTAVGSYTASVTVEYAAAVNFGSGLWREVAGVVRSTTGGYSVRIVDVSTALVDLTCRENPRGPGC